MTIGAAGGGALRDGTPVRVLDTDVDPRCQAPFPGRHDGVCGALLATKVTRPWAIRCRRCKHLNEKT